MNRSISILAALMLATTAQVWAGEENDSGVAKIQHESRQLLEQIKDYSAEQKDKAIAETADTLAKLDKCRPMAPTAKIFVASCTD